VNSIQKIPHFRHSKTSNCISKEIYKEFVDNDFCSNWFILFKMEFRKPYWFNIKLEQIVNENKIIMIRYSHQSKIIIENIEKYCINKAIWILSLNENIRPFSNIFHFKGKYYIDFKGSKNDIPLYNSNKSIVYLDTGYDVLLKVNLDSYINTGQEIELLNIKDFYDENIDVLLSYPIRNKWLYTEKLLNEKYKSYIDNYNNEINHILEYEKISYEFLNDEYLLSFFYNKYSKEFIKKHFTYMWGSLIEKRNDYRKNMNIYLRNGMMGYEYHKNDIDKLFKKYLLDKQLREKQILDFKKNQYFKDLSYEYYYEINQLLEYDKIIYDYYINIIKDLKLKYKYNKYIGKYWNHDTNLWIEL